MSESSSHLIYLKLGGSLITDKDTPHTARLDVLERLSAEIAAALRATPSLRLLLGHGSGSFGHIAAAKHGTRRGVSGPEGWLGFAEVWREARALNQIVIESLARQGVPALAFPPSALVVAEAGQVKSWPFEPIQAALAAGLVPVVQGDVVFDQTLGGTILSTEDCFIALAPTFPPARILLAGRDPGVFADFPRNQHLVERLTPAAFTQHAAGIHGSSSVDVTGGMLEKVQLMLSLTRQIPGLEASIFSGLQPGQVYGALTGARPGTTIAAH